MKELAAALDRARASRSRIGKEEAIAAALRAVADRSDEADLATAARIAVGRILPIGDGRSLGVGWALMLDVVRSTTGFDDEVVAACARVTGELAEAFGLLTARLPGAEGRPGVSLADVAALADALAGASARTAKRAALERAFARAGPLETKYLAKALGGGLRIGADQGVVEGAVGRAFGVTGDRLRRAAALLTDVGDLAVRAHRGDLDDARATPGHPVAFMLAAPIETVTGAIDPDAFAVEDKVDGVRAQAHAAADGDVVLFARGFERVTQAFPEVAAALASAPRPFVVDGEIVAVDTDGRPRPFQSLQPRLNKVAPTADDLADARVVLVAFDLLVDASGSLLDRPWHERRSRLEAWLAARGPNDAVVVHPACRLAAAEPFHEALEAAFTAARERGHEGLVLKRKDAPYEAGRRGRAWIKVKRAGATLDVVVVAAQEGHGRRAGALSDYTFAVWRDAELVVVGKAYSGLTDAEIDEMTRTFEASTTERRGGVRIVRPEIVLEVAFDGVQRSSRHGSGFALRFPRIVRIRHDKKPEDADRLAVVEAVLASQVASGHREGAARSRTRGEATGGAKRRKRRKTNASQLSLFDDE